MNNDEKKEKTYKNQMPLLRGIYLIKSNFPTSEIFFTLLFFFKYIGIIANTRIIEMTINKNTISLNKYLRNFFIFGKDFSIVNKHYQLITFSLAIFFLIYVFYIIFCFSYIKMKYKNINSLIDEKMEQNNEKIDNILFKIISYINITLVFFHQYILEYYSFGIYGFIYYQIGLFSKKGIFSNNYINTLHEDLSEYFSNNNHLFIFVVNLIVILYIFVILFLFLMFNNTKGLFLSHGLYSGNRKYLFCKLVIMSLQPLFGINNFYSEKAKIIFGLIIIVLINILCIFNFWSCFHQFGYYPNKHSNMILFLEFFVFFSTIAEVVLYFTGIKSTLIFFFIKLFIEIINSFFLMRIFLYFKNNHNLNDFAENLFSKNFTNVSKGGLYYYMRIYLEYQKDKSKNYLQLFRVLMTHVKMCKKIDCPGHILIPIEYLKSSFVPTTIKDKKHYNRNNEILNNKKSKNNLEAEKYYQDEDSDEESILNSNNKKNKETNMKGEKKIDENNNNEYSESIFDEKRKLNEKHFQIIFEQEIINKIDFLYKSKKFYILEDFIFIHLQYLYVMKKNYSLMLYYIGKYSKCGIKWTFITQYFLYEYKKVIISIFFNKSNISNVDENVNKYRKDYHFMEDIINYFIFSAILKKLVVNSCSKLKLFFSCIKDLHIPIVLKTYKYSKTKKNFEMGDALKKDIDKIFYFLRYHIKEMNQQTISPELSYIISNFFIFIENKIPPDLIKVLNPIFDVNIIANKLESGYKFLNLVQPLILSLTKNNTFNISYFSSVISNRLGFFQNELKNKDFHEKLFPGIHFIKQHELLMKHFLFFDNNSHIKKDSFLKSKEGYLIGVKLTVKKFPTFYEEFFLIIGIDFNDDLFFSEINKNFNRYSFLLDDNFDFVSQTKNFYEDFEFNTYMFKELKTNFFEFFCVDKNKFNEKLKKKNSTILNKAGVNNVYNLKKEDDAFSIFKTISYEKAYDLRDISKLESVKNEHIIIRNKISKSNIIKMIPQFSKLVEEYGLDCEWYQHLENLSERLSIKEIIKEDDNISEYSKNMVSLGYNTYAKKTNKNTIITNNSSTNNLLIQKNNNKEVKNINNESIDRRSFSTLSIMSKRNNPNNNDENYSKKLNENNNLSFKIILDRYFDAIYNLKKIGTIHFYIVDLYEKTLYKYNDSNSLLYEPKCKFSFSKRKIEELLPIVENKNKDNKFIKAKTLFSEKNRKRKNLDNFTLSNTKNILIEEKIEDDNNEPKEIEIAKTWGSDNDIINMKRHLIKEGERLFNRKEMSENIMENLSANFSDNKNQKKNTNISQKNKKNNFERVEKREVTKKD